MNRLVVKSKVGSDGVLHLAAGGSGRSGQGSSGHGGTDIPAEGNDSGRVGGLGGFDGRKHYGSDF